jgi:hypothetical protein
MMPDYLHILYAVNRAAGDHFRVIHPMLLVRRYMSSLNAVQERRGVTK